MYQTPCSTQHTCGPLPATRHKIKKLFRALDRLLALGSRLHLVSGNAEGKTKGWIREFPEHTKQEFLDDVSARAAAWLSIVDGAVAVTQLHT